MHRRRRTWYAAISHGELRTGFDPWVSEWGNPPQISRKFVLSDRKLAWDFPYRLAEPSALMRRAVRSEATEGRGSVRTGQFPARPGSAVRQKRFLDIIDRVSTPEYIGCKKRTQGTETSKYLQERTSTETP